MEGKAIALREKLEKLLAEAAEVSVALSRADGTIVGLPHYSTIELAAHELGREISRQVQARQMRELAAVDVPQAACPECGQRCELLPQKRQVTSIDGPCEATELVGRCLRCRKNFFPQRPTLGLDARQLTPTLVYKLAIATAETRSFQRAQLVIREVAGVSVSAKTIERVAHDVGGELAARRDANPKSADALAQHPEEPPQLAVVECGGGRIRVRQPGHGPGVHLEETGWREDKKRLLDSGLAADVRA